MNNSIKATLNQESDEFISNTDFLKYDPDILAFEDANTEKAKNFVDKTTKLTKKLLDSM